MTKKRGLGTPLAAILSGTNITEPSGNEELLHYLAVDSIHPGPYQPRHAITPEELQDLAASITAQGILQPIIVRPSMTTGYEIIAGERRWRAAKLAGLTVVPAMLKPCSNETAVAIALIENIQRQALTPLEEALALARLLNECGLTQQELAQTIGRSRSSISNTIRLLGLHPEVKMLLNAGSIDMGHARALLALTLDEQVHIAGMVVKRQLSVRQTEQVVAQTITPRPPKPGLASSWQALEDELAEQLQLPVRLTTTKRGGGQIIINYKNHAQVAALLKLCTVNHDES